MASRNWKHGVVEVESDVRIAYIDCPSRETKDASQKGTILLIHGFPQSSYQFRHVIDPLAEAGYRVLSPDYRGVGASSKPSSGFTKAVMANDLVRLMDVLGIKEPVHVVGHDIGGMIAFALASRYPARVASLNWGECPLPGTSAYIEDRTTNAVKQFHFIFHSVPDLAVALVSGRERIYLSHFYQKLAHNTAAIQDQDVDHYVRQYESPGALRFAFEMYRAFEDDADDNKRWFAEHGKLDIPTLGLNGEKSRHAQTLQAMYSEAHKGGTYEFAYVPEAGHYVAEENPEAFVEETLRFIEKINAN